MDLCERSPLFLKAQFFVDKYDVSLRTIQSDIKSIKNQIKDIETVKLVSVASKGSKLVSHDKNELEKFIQRIAQDYTYSKLSDQSERVRQIIFLLLNNKNYMSHQQLMDRIYVSYSTLISDLKMADHFLNDFDLIIERRSHYGLKIQGEEKNRRKFIVKLGNQEVGANFKTHTIEEKKASISDIEKILVEILVKHHYRISEMVFQNLIIHMDTAIRRMRQGFYLEKTTEDISNEFKNELNIAQEIYDYIGKRFFVKPSHEEVKNLAIYFKGKSDYGLNDYISEEVNDFILTSLVEIREKFGFDFTQEIELRISLALHFMPLITRIQHNMQMENHLLDEIKKSFPLAFDIAVYMSLLLQEKYGKRIREEETAYLAIYFNQHLTKLIDIAGKQRVLIVTSMKRSESILLRQRFATWFNNDISVLTIVNTLDVSEIDFNDYDVFFTTEENELSEMLGAILISFFPSDKEYSKIKLAIDGFNDKKEIINLFHRELFFSGKLKTKEKVLERLCFLSKDFVNGDSSHLLSSIHLREELGSSYFGNRIALPHPINPLTSETFVAVSLLKEKIFWDNDKNMVQVVMLVAIEKNNTKAFQLWNYLSKIIQEEDYVKEIIQKPTFDNFIRVLSKSLDDVI